MYKHNCSQNYGTLHRCYTPPPREYIKQIVAAVVWYIWQGAIFRVRLSTFQRRKEDGGWNVIEVETKCRALLITRIWQQWQREGTMTTERLKYCMLKKRRKSSQYKKDP